MTRSAENSVAEKMLNSVAILIVTIVILHLGLSIYASNQLPSTKSAIERTSADSKISENLCINSTSRKRCLKCRTDGYAYYHGKGSITEHGCSDDKPLEIFFEDFEYNGDFIACPNNESYYNKTDEMDATGIPNILEYSRFYGCFNYTEKFPFRKILSKSNSNKRCLNICNERGYEYAGTANGSHCLCTNQTLKNRIEDSFLCEKMTCPGEPTEKCGAEDKIKLYVTKQNDNRTRLIDPVLVNWIVRDDKVPLPGYLFKSNATFNESLITNCHRYCMKSGFQHFSVLVKNRRLSLAGSNCFCGDLEKSEDAEYFLDFYSGNCIVDGIFIFETGLSDANISADNNAIGCYQINELKKTLIGITTFHDMKTLTPKTCLMTCDYLAYSYFAVEKGSDCHCFDYFNKTKINSKLSDVECNVRCLGDVFQTCGGSGYRMKVFETPFGQKQKATTPHTVNELEFN